MSKVGYIYKATSPSGRSYIGQSTLSLKTRVKKHKNDAKIYSYAFANAINKYGIDSFVWVVLEDNIPIKYINEKEVHYIKHHDTYNNGYNSTEGGDFNPMLYEDIRKKVSNNTKGVKHNIDQSGENNHRAKLDWDIVSKIRYEYLNSNSTHSDLAIKFKVCRRTIGNIINNICWVDRNYTIPEKNKKDKLSYKIAESIRKEYKDGNTSYDDLAKKYKVSFQNIGSIIQNKIWKSK